MNITALQVRIYDKEKCIHERKIARSDENNLRTLMQNLREVQSETNNVLTTLIQRDVSIDAQSSSIYA